MENVYDSIFSKQLLFVLPENSLEKSRKVEVLEKAAIAVNLYYEDTVPKYLEYLNNVPEEIDVYIISSNPVVWNMVENFVSRRKGTYLINKDNRGRDISALLVAFREIALRYEYICFVHDKKEKQQFMKEDIDFWVKNLWDNTLKSAHYICNVLNTFENSNIGVLVPPEPIGEYKNDWYKNVWYEDFEITKKLADELGLVCNISNEKSPITLGTAFWCRTVALKKLFEKEWRYEDFPKEPLADDGTISHAIERIFAYVAQDAKFDTGVIMCNSYAESLILNLKSNLTQTYSLLKREFGIHNIHQIKNYDEQRVIADKFFRQYKKIFLYGAGYCGQEFLLTLKSWGYCPDGFVVTDGQKHSNYLADLPVFELKELERKEEIGIFITVNYGIQSELEKNLIKQGFANYYKAYVC